MVIYCVAMVLEGLHSNFAVLITSKNEVPLLKHLFFQECVLYV